MQQFRSYGLVRQRYDGIYQVGPAKCLHRRQLMHINQKDNIGY